MSTDAGRLVPIACTVSRFSDTSIVLQTLHEEHSAPDDLTFTVTTDLVMLNLCESVVGFGEHLYTSLSTAEHAGSMQPHRQADAMQADFVIAWLPVWIATTRNIKSIEPQLPEVATCDTFH